jgi:SAM-dependent methyltransferase
MASSTESIAPIPTDPGACSRWAGRWYTRMTDFFPGRDESIAVMLDLVTELAGPEPDRILDLGSGPGPLAARLLARFPRAHVAALDFDPVLLQIGRGALGDAGGRLTWVHSNLREIDWTGALAGLGPFDAVLSVATLHHLPAREVRRIYGDLAGLIRPDGLFINTEGMIPSRPGSRLRAAPQRARLRNQPEPDSWWDDVAADPELASLAAERRALLDRFPTDRVRHASAERHCRDLRAAGFAEAAIVWRRHDETVVAAIR